MWRLVSRTVKREVLLDLIKLLKAKAAAGSVIPTTAERFVVRIDEKPPTLAFLEDHMSSAGFLFNRGKLSPPLFFDSLIKELLFLPQSQNEALTRSIQVEKMFLKFKKDKNFATIFQYVEQMDRVGRPRLLYSLTKSVQLEEDSNDHGCQTSGGLWEI